MQTILCAECGETNLPQGFCDICEAWWCQSPGTDCPKHDVPLTDCPEIQESAGSSKKLVVLASYSLPSEAHGPKLRLEAEGIPTFLDGARMAETVIYAGATGGVKLLVPEEFVTDARILLSQTWAAPKGDADDGDEDDEWAGLEPLDAADKRRSLMKKMILVYLFWPILAAMILAVLLGLVQLIG